MYKKISTFKKNLFLVFLLGFNQHLFANTVASNELKQVLTPVQNLQGRFEQTMKNEQGKILQKLNGKLYLRKPGQFRWEILKPEPRLVIADGKKIWDYDKELDQVTVQKVAKGQTKAPIYFLTGEVNSLDKDFQIAKFNNSDVKEDKKLNQQVCMKNSDSCFELKPKKEEGSFQWIRIGFKNAKLNELELLDQLGQNSFFEFIEIDINQSIADNLFQFTPPKGVDVLENP